MKRLNYYSSNLFLLYNVKLRNFFFFNFLDFYFLFFINFIYFNLFELKYSKSKNSICIYLKNLNKLPNLPQRFYYLKYTLFFNFFFKNEDMNFNKLIFLLSIF